MSQKRRYGRDSAEGSAGSLQRFPDSWLDLVLLCDREERETTRKRDQGGEKRGKEKWRELGKRRNEKMGKLRNSREGIFYLLTSGLPRHSQHFVKS